jgi:hypothetical protein
MSARDPVVTERWALAVLRVSLGVFLLLWGVEKFVIPTTTVRIWEKFYGVGLGAALVPPSGPSRARSRSRSWSDCGGG